MGMCMCSRCKREHLEIEWRQAKLRDFLAVRGITLSAIAKTIGISQPYLSQVLRSRRPALRIRERLMSEFGIPADLVSVSAAHDSTIREPVGAANVRS